MEETLLHLIKEDTTMAKKWLPIPKPLPGWIVPTEWAKCLSYYEEQLYMWAKIQELEERIRELEEKVNE